MRLDHLGNVCALLLSTACLAAHADTITQTFNSGPFATNGSYQVNRSPINQFNPTLGTFDSVTASVSGSYLVTGTSANSQSSPQFGVNLVNNAYLFVEYGPYESFDGTYSFSGSDTTTAPVYLAYLTGTGQVHPGFDYQEGSGAVDKNATPEGFAVTITYNYTPVGAPSPVPEPSSFLLLASGLLGLAGCASFVRRRSDRTTAGLTRTIY